MGLGDWLSRTFGGIDDSVDAEADNGTSQAVRYCITERTLAARSDHDKA